MEPLRFRTSGWGFGLDHVPIYDVGLSGPDSFQPSLRLEVGTRSSRKARYYRPTDESAMGHSRLRASVLRGSNSLGLMYTDPDLRG